MEIQSLRLEPDLSQQKHHQYITTTPNNIFQMISPRVKIDLSDSSSPVPGQWTDSNFLAAVYGYVGPSIVTFGLIGNLLILLVVGRSSMSGAMPVYLSALALSDMGALLSSIPLWIRLSEQVNCSPWNAYYYGHFELFVLTTFMAASIFCVMALTLERYTSVCWAGRFPAMHTPHRAKMAVALSYLLALITSLPLCFLKKVEIYDEAEREARPEKWCPYQYFENEIVTGHPLWTVYVWLGESVVRFLPALVLAVLNSMIMIKFRGVVKTRLHMQEHGQPPPAAATAAAQHARTDRHLEQERKLLTLLLSITVLFFVTNIPSAILSIIYSQSLEHKYSFQVFRAVANLLEVANFALNFCMYFLCSKEFRKMLFQAFPHCRWPKIFESLSTSSTRSTTASGNSGQPRETAGRTISTPLHTTTQPRFH